MVASAYSGRHGRAAQALARSDSRARREPSDSSGAWGAWAKSVQGTMNLFGEPRPLKSLRKRRAWPEDYQEGLDDIDMTSADLISTNCPAQQRTLICWIS